MTSQQAGIYTRKDTTPINIQPYSLRLFLSEDLTTMIALRLNL